MPLIAALLILLGILALLFAAVAVAFTVGTVVAVVVVSVIIAATNYAVRTGAASRVPCSARRWSCSCLPSASSA